MSRPHQLLLYRLATDFLHTFFERIVKLRRGTFFFLIDQPQIFRAAEFFFIFSKEDNALFFTGKTGCRNCCHILHQPDYSQHRRGINGLPFCLVVKADITASHRNIKLPTGSSNAFDRLFKLPHNLGLFRIAEIQAIGDTHRCGPDAGQIAAGLSHGYFPASPGIQVGIKRVSVQSHGETLFAPFKPQNGGICSGQNNRIYLHHMIVLPENPALISYIR